MALSLRQILYQSDLRSSPVRLNFTDIENFVNDLQDQIDNLATPPAGTEVTNARDYHSVLRDRLRSASKAQGNVRVTGGEVTVNADTTKLDVAAGEAIVDGVACKWTSATSASLTASAANKHRVDLVVVNSDSTISIITGSEVDDTTVNPSIPIPSSSQLSLAAIYVPDTSPVNNTGNIYDLHDDVAGRQNVFYKIATTIGQGRYQYNNCIIDAAITISVVETSSWYMAAHRYISINCTGRFYLTSNGSIVTSDLNVETGGTDGIEPFYKNGGDASGGGTNSGGGGGASAVADGGAGKAGTIGTPGAGANHLTLNSTSATLFHWFTAGRGGTTPTPALKIAIVFGIKAKEIYIDGDINNDGGSDATTPSQAGGNGGGITLLIAEDDITINSGTVSCRGGDGGDNSGVGGGGGGGGGGLIVIRSTTYTNNGTVTASGGVVGSNGTGGANGDDGIVDQKLYSDSSSIVSAIPLNIIEF